MATLAITYSQGTEVGAALRALARDIEAVAANIPDRVHGGADTVLTIDNAPATGEASVQITAGPYQSSVRISG